MSCPRDKHGAEADDDFLFLDQVLNKLYDFGGAGKRKWKKSQKREGSSAKEERDMGENRDMVSHDTNSDQHMSNVSNSTVCENTKSGTGQSTVEVVTFIDPLKKNRLSKAVEPEQKTPDNKDNKKTDLDKNLTIEKARFEVHRLGLSGYQKQQQRIYEQDRAIMLGARPPKKQYVNYKMYQEMIKEKKLKEKEEAKSNAQKKKRKFRKPRSASDGQLGGQVGRFRNGMLVLSSKDIRKVNDKMRK